MTKIISILGSTGSIGLTSLNIIEKKKNYFKIFLLSADKNYKLIIKQIKKYQPKIFVINNYLVFKKVSKIIKNKKTLIVNEINYNLIKKKIDITISAIPGIAGLLPTIKIIEKSKKVLIANKESIICGWNLIKKIANKNQTTIIPVDSEHFSIFKLLENSHYNQIKKVYITASGGPFLNLEQKKFKNIKVNQALKHPKWKMGKKISIDSATLMNKMLELIEAHKLFKIPLNKIEILIHPSSIVHAIVNFNNGINKLLYHSTSMAIPLANAIFDGKLLIDEFVPKIRSDKKDVMLSQFNFKKVDKKIFPIINIKNRLNEYPSTPIIINASNEILVQEFLKKKIPFLAIYKTIIKVINDRNYKKYAVKKPSNLKKIQLIDLWAKKKVLQLLKKI